MPVPSASGFSSGSATAGNTSVTFAHTSDGSPIYVQITASTISAFSGEEDFATPCTFNGVAMERWVSWFSSGTGDIMRVWVFSLLNPGSVTANVVFDGSALAAGGWNGIRAWAANVADGPINGGLVMPGGWYNFGDTTTLTREVYGWDDSGLQITTAWGGSVTPTTLTGGTLLGTGTGIRVHTEATADGQLAYTTTRALGKLGLFSFMIPPGDQSLTSNTFHPWITGHGSVTFTTVGDFGQGGLPYVNDFDNVAPQRLGNNIPIPGTIRSWNVRANSDPGVGRTIRVELIGASYDGSVSEEGTLYACLRGTYIDLTSANWQGAKVTGLDVPFYRYEQLGLRATYLAGAGSPGSMTFKSTFIVESGVADEHVYGGGIQTQAGVTVGVASRLGVLHPWPGAWVTFPSSQKSLVGVACTITELLVAYQSETSIATDYQYYLEVIRYLGGQTYAAAQLQDGTGGSVDTTATLIDDVANRSYARSRFSLALNPGDLISVVAIPRSGASAGLRHAAHLKVIPTTPGAFMVSGHAVNSAGTDYNALINSARDNWGSADEALRTINIPPLDAVGAPITVGGLRGYLEPAAGAAKSWSVTIRQNLADTSINLVLADTDITGTVGGSVDFVEDDGLGIVWDAISGPTAARQWWTIPGLLLPPASLGTIIVTKDAGGDVSTVFGYTTSGGLSPGTFTLVGGASQSFPDLVPGTGYGVSETTIPANWQLSGVVVSNGSPPGNITVDPGETVTVTFTNIEVICPGERSEVRMDGLSYRPVVAAGQVLTINGEIITLNGVPITIADCAGPGVRSGRRSGA